jgi:periplasmic divalent cation tolerance protein
MEAIMKLCFVYITTGNLEEAQEIGNELVRSRLAACVNLMDSMHSMYRWKGKIEKAHEVVLIAKTRMALADQLIRKAKTMHSAECPCIVVLPIAKGNPAFMKWIEKETK